MVDKTGNDDTQSGKVKWSWRANEWIRKRQTKRDWRSKWESWFQRRGNV